MVVGGGGCGGANPYSCQTQLSFNCVRLFWGCVGVVLCLSCGFDNNVTDGQRNECDRLSDNITSRAAHRS